MVDPVAPRLVPFYDDTAHRRQLQIELAQMEPLPWGEDTLAAPLREWLTNFNEARRSCRAGARAADLGDREKALTREFATQLEILLQQATLRVAAEGTEHPVLRHMAQWLRKHKMDVSPDLEVFEREAPAPQAPVIQRVSDVFRRARGAVRPRDEEAGRDFQNQLAAMRAAVQAHLAAEVAPVQRDIEERDAEVGAALEAVRARDEAAAPDLRGAMEEIEGIQEAVDAGLLEFNADLREHRAGLDAIRVDNADLRVQIEVARQVIAENNRKASSGKAVIEGLAAIAVVAAIKWALPAAPTPSLFPGGGSVTVLSFPL